VEKAIIIAVLIFISISLFAGESPYPIIFVHGLNSSNDGWEETISALDDYFGSDFLDLESDEPEHVFHAVLNAYEDMTNVAGPDSTLNGNMGSDDDVQFVFANEYNTLAPGSLYAINFENFWSVDSLTIDYHNNGTPDIYLWENESDSNESAICKQGYALKRCIQFVLTANDADKVILVGHSMGGLAIREYLQRMEGDQHRWWVHPSDTINGHRVARVVTIGTPHLGSNASVIDLTSRISAPDEASEAVRDLRYNNSIFDGVYLSGGDEANIGVSYDNDDVDCNGEEDDLILGLNENDEYTYNQLMPLPSSVKYTWITSNCWLGENFLDTFASVALLDWLELILDDIDGDGTVLLEKQWLRNSSNIPTPIGVSDTLLIHRPHINLEILGIGFEGEMKAWEAILRGMDEPEDTLLAYALSSWKWYTAFFTMPPADTNTLEDKDLFRFTLESASDVSVYWFIDHIPDQNAQIQIRDEDYQVVSSCWYPDYPILNLPSGTYYLQFSRVNTAASEPVHYGFKIEAVESNQADLVAYYQFNGNVDDSSGNNNHGSIHGGISYCEDRLGNADRAIYCDGNYASSYVEIDSDPVLNVQQFTIAAWVKWLGEDTQGMPCGGVFSNGYSHDRYSLVAGGTFFRTFINYPGTNCEHAYSTTVLGDHQYHFIAGSYNGSERKLWLDGQLVASDSFSQPIQYSYTENSYIGCNFPGGHDTFYGCIDELRVYNRALTETEMQNIFNNEAPSPNAIVTPSIITEMLQPNETAQQSIHIANTGNSELTYPLTTGAARRQNNTPRQAIQLEKGDVDTRRGSSPSRGQGGPDYWGYTWIDSDEAGGPAFEWNDISTTGFEVTGWVQTGTYSAEDEGYAGPFDLGFSFPFYESASDSLFLNANGFIGFNENTVNLNAWTNTDIPTSAEPNGIVVPFWDDMNGANGGTVYVQQEADQFIIQYDNWAYYSSSSNYATWQTVLAADGSIRFNYLEFDGTVTSCTVGLENADGSDGLPIVFNAAYLHDSMSILITPNTDEPWLTLGSSGGTVTSGETENVTVNFNSEGLLEGLYTTNIYVSSNDPDEPLVTVPVTLEVLEVIATPDSPENVLIDIIGDDVVLSWDESDADSYKVYASNDVNMPQQTLVTTQGDFSTLSARVIWTAPIPTTDWKYYCVSAVNKNPAAPEGMVYVPAGTFQMGDTQGGGQSIELPVHTVNIDAFYIGINEVKILDYILFMNDVGMPVSGVYNGNQCVTQIDGNSGISFSNGEYVYLEGSYNSSSSCPMIYVTWYGAVEYCNWLSSESGLTLCYAVNGSDVACNWGANGYRLPTEAEWEYSARGATNTPEYFYSGSSNIDAVAWYSGNSSSQCHEVGQLQANGVGTHDQSGNVWEWCWDWFESDYYSCSPTDNPTGPESGVSHVYRGGRWSGIEYYCRVAFRAAWPQTGSVYDGGFRLCKKAE